MRHRRKVNMAAKPVNATLRDDLEPSDQRGRDIDNIFRREGSAELLNSIGTEEPEVSTHLMTLCEIQGSMHPDQARLKSGTAKLQ